MKIKNETRYDTVDLRRLLAAVARRELEPDQAKRLVVLVKHSRGVGCLSGCATLFGSRMTLRLPKRRALSPAFEPRYLAYLMAHEMGHIRGLRHRQMRGTHLSGWKTDLYAWADAFPISMKREPAPKPKPGAEQKLEKARAMLTEKERQARRVAGLLRKWKRKVRYYERILAKAASPTMPEVNCV